MNPSTRLGEDLRYFCRIKDAGPTLLQSVKKQFSEFSKKNTRREGPPLIKPGMALFSELFSELTRPAYTSWAGELYEGWEEDSRTVLKALLSLAKISSNDITTRRATQGGDEKNPPKVRIVIVLRTPRWEHARSLFLQWHAQWKKVKAPAPAESLLKHFCKSNASFPKTHLPNIILEPLKALLAVRKAWKEVNIVVVDYESTTKHFAGGLLGAFLKSPALLNITIDNNFNSVINTPTVLDDRTRRALRSTTSEELSLQPAARNDYILNNNNNNSAAILGGDTMGFPRLTGGTSGRLLASEAKIPSDEEKKPHPSDESLWTTLWPTLTTLKANVKGSATTSKKEKDHFPAAARPFAERILALRDCIPKRFAFEEGTEEEPSELFVKSFKRDEFWYVRANEESGKLEHLDARQFFLKMPHLRPKKCDQLQLEQAWKDFRTRFCNK